MCCWLLSVLLVTFITDTVDVETVNDSGGGNGDVMKGSSYGIHVTGAATDDGTNNGGCLIDSSCNIGIRAESLFS